MNQIVRKNKTFDATDKTIGRLATAVATALRGKDQPEYVPYIDAGAVVEVKNISKIKFTGKKLDQKKYYSYSGYPGGLKTKKMSEVLAKDPGEVLYRAVKQMLPANRLRNDMLKRLIIK